MTSGTRNAVLGAVVAGVVIYASVFTVDVTESAVVTQFGDPVQVVTEPGLRFRIPFVQQVRHFDARLRLFEPVQAEYLTKDKKNIVVASFALWRVGDPLRYYRAIPSEAAALGQMTDVISSELGASLGAIPFDELINTDASARRLREMVDSIEEAVHKVAGEEFGIEVVDFDVKRLAFPDQNRRSVFERMRAEREMIARRYRSEGEEEARKIRAQADREESRILSEAYRDAEIIRGRGEAEATRIYGEAIARDPGFYEFTRTLEAYRTFLDDNTTLILPADAEIMRLLTEGVDGMAEAK
ncbi:MAG: protease modulator HflC [Gemmatimonadota bacterium]|nr:protease modulator HflC [Gemmatimonadota bacterium]MDP6802887.1 protease modulator HflC [Gemmatimonadota bacterium]MDP7031443.1 protease modulator HflC [Gemmatimonadota bacterium]